MKISEGQIKVTDFASLQQEKRRLKKLCRDMERQLDERFDHLKENYGAMALNTVFPGAGSGSNGWKWLPGIAAVAWKAFPAVMSKKLSRVALRATKIKPIYAAVLISIFEFVAARYGLKIYRKFFGKETKRQEKVD